MTHSDIFNKFKEIAKVTDEEVLCWFTNGKGSVRVRFLDYQEVVFTYHSDTKWMIESKALFMDRM